MGGGKISQTCTIKTSEYAKKNGSSEVLKLQISTDPSFLCIFFCSVPPPGPGPGPGASAKQVVLSTSDRRTGGCGVRGHAFVRAGAGHQARKRCACMPCAMCTNNSAFFFSFSRYMGRFGSSCIACWVLWCCGAGWLVGWLVVNFGHFGLCVGVWRLASATAFFFSLR
ncbi:hypothetical protein BC826DRAFT_162185 [Russula brevipes]|nr:hypothetical protein BC826DRAFT_162185 [Russula brevipes]